MASLGVHLVLLSLGSFWSSYLGVSSSPKWLRLSEMTCSLGCTSHWPIVSHHDTELYVCPLVIIKGVLCHGIKHHANKPP